MYLEKKYGSAYSTDRERPSAPCDNKNKNTAPPAAQPPLLTTGEGAGAGGKKKKGKANKNKQQRSQSSSPAGERFDLRCDVYLAAIHAEGIVCSRPA